MAQGLAARIRVTVEPSLPGDGNSVTLWQARELLGSDRARQEVAAALASVPGIAPVAETVIDTVLRAVAGLLPAETERPSWLRPGWQYREELMPRIAALLARRQV